MDGWIGGCVGGWMIHAGLIDWWMDVRESGWVDGWVMHGLSLRVNE